MRFNILAKITNLSKGHLKISINHEEIKIKRNILHNPSQAENQRIINKLKMLNIVIDNKYNPYGDALEIHKLIKNPNPYYPNIKEKDIKILFKTITKNLPLYNSSLPKNFLWLKKRVSTRNFAEDKLSLRNVNKILNISYGIIKINRDYYNARHRTVPSAGAIYPLIPVYFSFKDSKIYIYNGNKLIYTKKKFILDDLINNAIYEKADEIIDFKNATGLISLFADLKYICSKYGPRGYLFTILEAGHVMQNIYLSSIKEDIGVCELGCILDDEILSFLNWQNSSKIHIISTVVGSILK